MRLNRVDLLLVLLGFILVTASSYQLIFTGSLTSGMGIGFLKNMEQTVKTRQGSDLFWSTPFLGSAIQENQLVFTAEGSKVLIALNDGSSIEVGENSLVKVKSKNLDFVKGEMKTILSGSDLEIQVGDKTLTLSSKDSAEVAIQKLGDNTLIGVVSGNVKVDDGKGVVHAGNEQFVEVEADQLKVKERLEINPLPKSSELFYSKDKTLLIEFGNYSGDIYLSSRSDFKNSKILKERKVRLAPGHYSWRVVSKNSESLIYQFRIVSDVAPKVYRPLNQEVFRTELPVKLNLQWDSVKNNEAVVEIKHGDQLTQESAQNGIYSLLIKEAGEYQWRVKYKIAGYEDSSWTSWQNFIVKDLASDVPKGLSPLNYEVKTYDLKNERIDFNWDYSGDVLFSVSDKNGEVFSQKVKDKYSWQPSGEGEFRIKVRSFDNPLKLWSEEAVVKIVDLSTLKDVAVHSIELARPDQEVDFNWQGGKGEYLFELSSTQDFKEIIISKKVKSPETKINIPQVGSYFWRSRVLEKGKWKVSPPTRVVIRPTPGPSKPKSLPSLKLPLRLKKTSQVFSFVSSAFAQEERFVNIKLPQVEDAKFYRLEIFEDKDLGKLIFKKTSKRNNITWPDARGGRFYYRYSVIDFWDRESEPSEASVLEVTHEHLIPKHLDGLRVEIQKGKIKVSWEKDELASFYRLELSQNRNFENAKVTTTSSLTHSFEVESGQYFLRMTGLNDFGQSKSITKKFNILLKDNVLVEADKNYLFALYRPSLDQLKFSSSEDGTIDGNALGAVEVRYERLDEYLSILKADYVMGSVFDGESYSSYSLEGSLDYILKNDDFKFSLGMMAKFWQLPSYLVKTKVTAESESHLVLGGHARLSQKMKDFDLVFDQYVYAMNVTGFMSELSLRKTFNQYHAFSGLSYESSKWKDHDKTSIILKLGLGISF